MFCTEAATDMYISDCVPCSDVHTDTASTNTLPLLLQGPRYFLLLPKQFCFSQESHFLPLAAHESCSLSGMGQWTLVTCVGTTVNKHL